MMTDKVEVYCIICGVAFMVERSKLHDLDPVEFDWACDRCFADPEARHGREKSAGDQFAEMLDSHGIKYTRGNGQ
jgi:hypothetical protein